MSLSAREIGALVEELQALVGARVDAVRVHAERALTLELRSRDVDVTLLLSAEADVTRLQVATRRPPQPEAPFAFQGLLRKELEGARLAAVETIPGDRVVALRFERVAGPVSLVAELTGRHGNLFLVAADGIIRASAGRNLSQRRPLFPGQPYLAPAPPPGGADADRFAAAAAGPGPFPRSAAVEAHYAAVEAQRALAEARRRLREPLRAALARSRRALEKLADEAARVPAAEEDRRKGDLLKSNLHRVKRGQREVTVTEWTAEGSREVTIGLDPALTPQANVERTYRHYRRIVDSAARVAARTAEVEGRVAHLAALVAEVDAAALDALPRLEREARKLAAGPRRAQAVPGRRKRDEALPPYRTFRALSGATILVGRGAAENDELTKRVAKGNDLWVHARGRTGAHVVVRLDKDRAPDQDALLDAAHLAAHFSDARGEPVVDVAYTRVKYVRKPKGAAPGAVVYTQEKVLALRVEGQRIERLLGEEAGE